MMPDGQPGRSPNAPVDTVAGPRAGPRPKGDQRERVLGDSGARPSKDGPSVTWGLSGRWTVPLQSRTATMATHFRLQATRKRARIKRAAGYSSAVEGGLLSDSSILRLLGAILVIVAGLKLF